MRVEEREILVTGGTGFVGRRLVPMLAQSYGRVYLLVREGKVTAVRAAYAALSNVQVLPGDLTLPSVVESSLVTRDEARSLLFGCTDLLHLAALYDLEAPAEQAYAANVVGTQNLLSFADGLAGLQRLHHISTIAVAGDYRGLFTEDMFNVGQGFPNAYARTKFRAEGLVGGWRRAIPRYVYRLGVVTGDSRTGAIPKVDGPYYFLNSLARHGFLWRQLARPGVVPMPYRRASVIPLIPVDVVADTLATLLRNPVPIEGRLRTYHLCGAQVPVERLIATAFAAFGVRGGALPVPSALIPNALLKAVGIPRELVHYMESQAAFGTERLQADHPGVRFPEFEAFFPAALAWAQAHLPAKGALPEGTT
jgi:thioester reductase-like protein